MDEIDSTLAKENVFHNQFTIKIDVYQIDDTWKLDLLDIIIYGPENKRGYRYVLDVIDNFSKFIWTVLLKNKNAQTIKNSFENNLKSSKENKLGLKSMMDPNLFTKHLLVS